MLCLYPAILPQAVSLEQVINPLSLVIETEGHGNRCRRSIGQEGRDDELGEGMFTRRRVDNTDDLSLMDDLQRRATISIISKCLSGRRYCMQLPRFVRVMFYRSSVRKEQRSPESCSGKCRKTSPSFDLA